MRSALRWACGHPVNAGKRPRVVVRWSLHQLRKRLLPKAPMAVQVGPATLVGPPQHPCICLARYVEGGLVDAEAFLVYASVLHPGDAFVDVGANIGLHSVVAAARVGAEGRVIACEPDAGSHPWLALNLSRAGAPWFLEARPLADRVRFVAWVPESATLSHIDSEPASGIAASVQTTTADALLAGLGLNPERTVMKIDVEGWEPAVIVGAGRSLAAGLRAVWIEAIGLQGRCDVAWDQAVGLCREHGMRFWVVDLRSRIVAESTEPALESPTGHYLIARPAVARAVATAVERWPGSLVWRPTDESWSG